MFRSLFKVIQSRPKTVLLIVALILLAGTAGTAGGAYYYALHQWHESEVALKEDRPEDAESCLRFCLKVWPQSVPVHLRAARAARLTGDFDGAESHLNQCLKLQHGATEAIQLEFLLMRVQRGEEDEVLPLLMEYVKNKDPETPLILETLARANMFHLRYGPAVHFLNLWIEETPRMAKPYHWRAMVLENLGDFTGAMTDYQLALELDPELVEVRLRVAGIWLERANPPEALPHLQWLRKRFPDRPDVMAKLGLCCFMEGQAEEARRLYEAAVEKLPNDTSLLLNLAKLEMQESRPHEAEPWLRRLLKVDPFDTEGLLTLYRSLQDQGRLEEAAAVQDQYHKNQALLDRANKLLKDEAEHPTGDPNNAYETGAALLRIGQDRTGLYWLNQALEGDPKHQAALRTLAEYYQNKGDREKAESFLRRLVKLDNKAASP